MDFNSGVQEIWDKVESWYHSMVGMVPNIVLAILVLVLTVVLAKLLKKGLRKLMDKTNWNQELAGILSTLAYITVMIIGMMVILSILNLDKTVTSLLAGAGIVGLALSFAFQDMATNFVSGLFMAIRKPFEIGDLIQVEDHIGTVQIMSLRATEITTLEGNQVRIPNKILFQNPVTNFYRDMSRRVELSIGVGYGEDLDKVEKVALDTIASIPGLMRERPVSVLFREFGDSAIILDVFYWVRYDNHLEFLSATSEGVKALKRAFQKEGIEIPFPIRVLRIQSMPERLGMDD